MINTATDYHAAIDFLTQETEVNIGDINEKMSSKEINNIFGNIEIQLIDLYEKTRVLEDVQNYCREYLIKTIEEKRKEFESKLKIIEYNADNYQETSFIACEIPFTDNSEPVRDRDGFTIPVSEIVNNKIIASGYNTEEIVFENISKKQSYLHYRDNLKDLTNNRTYRVFYIFDSPVEGGVVEEIIIDFNNMCKCNFLDIKTSNCEIIDIKYINQLDIDEPVNNIQNVCGTLKNVKGLKIKIRCNNYQIEEHQIDATKTRKDFWGFISKNQSGQMLSKDSVYNIAQTVGKTQYEQAQDIFRHKIKTWHKAKSEIDKQNIVMIQKFEGDKT